MQINQNLAIQVARLLNAEFPLYNHSDANIHQVMGYFEERLSMYRGVTVPSDAGVILVIKELRDKGRLALDPEVQGNIRELKSTRPNVWWNEASLGIVLAAAKPDYSLANLEYQTDENIDSLPLTPAYRQSQEQAQREHRQAAQDLLDGATIRAEFLQVFEKQKLMYVRSGGQHAWKFAQAQEQKRLASMTIERLREIKAARDAKLNLAATAEVNRIGWKAAQGGTQQVGNENADYLPSKSESMPLTMPNPKPGMQHEMLDLSATGLKRLSATDYGLFKYIVRSFHADAVNARLNEQN